ncbi:MAG TPA: dUTP diphosphatase, partial [candidate division Zixibacteria bacterium]|nr:dUTP diphosphatase [candidate division Zixibacteria bacterium]
MPARTVRIKFSVLSPLARVPAYATARAAGMDLCAAVEKPIRLKPGKFLLVPTGLAVEIPR